MGIAYAQNMADVHLSRDPVNRGHFLNKQRAAWWLAIPGTYGNGYQARDLMGANHGTLTNMVAGASGYRPTGRPGGFGHLLFDGVNDYVTAPLVSILTTGFTIAIWLATSASVGSSTNGGCPILNGNIGVNGWGFFQQGLGLTGFAEGVAFAATPSYTLTIGAWVRAAMTVAGGVNTLYINGVSVGTGSSTFSTPTAGGCILGSEQTGSRPWPGRLDDASIWNRALSAAEVKADYDLSRLGYPGVLNRIAPVFYSIPSGVSGLLLERRRRLLA